MKLLYEDSEILVCYKESGLPVQSARVGTKDMVSMLKNYLWEQGGSRREPYLGVIHRLDQPVEGVLVFAKSARAAASLSEQIRTGRMHKTYQAVVYENQNDIAGCGTLQDYLKKDPKGNCSRVVSKGTEGSKEARLEYQILKELPAGTEAGSEMQHKKALVQIQLFTGRHHQIRVQMAHAGLPLYGDRKYGMADPQNDHAALALCSVRLEFLHPVSGEPVIFTCAPKGASFQEFLSGC